MNIFISGLPYSLSDGELAEVFSKFGEVSSAKVVMDRESGRSRGFGFVEMGDAEEARAAISALDQSDLKGRKVIVREAEDRPQRNSGGGGGGFGNRGGYGNR